VIPSTPTGLEIIYSIPDTINTVLKDPLKIRWEKLQGAPLNAFNWHQGVDLILARWVEDAGAEVLQ
jgi:hypothetical protein